MADVIDAFLITLGLDSAKFNKGKADIKKGLRETSNEAATTAKDMEARGKQAAQFFSSIKTEALSLLAVLTAGAGLKAFMSESIKSSSEVGRLAQNLSMSTEQLSAWQGAAARSGGSADAMAATFRNVSGELAKFKMGLSSDFVAWFARAGGDFTKLKEANGTMIEMSRIISDLDKKDPGKALLVAKNLGVDESTFNFLRQGPQYVQAQIEAQKRLGVVSAEDARQAQKMQATLEALRQTSEKLGRDLLTKAAPALEWLAQKLSDLAVLAQDHGPMVVGFFTAMAIAIVAPMAEIILITAAIAAVAVAIGYVYEQWVKWMDGSESSLGAFFQFFADTWHKIRAEYAGTFEALSEFASAWWESIKAVINLVRALMFGTSADIEAAWGRLVDAMGAYFKKFGQLLATYLAEGIPATMEVFGRLLAWVEGRFAALWGAIVDGAIQVTPAIGNAILDAFLHPFDTIKKEISGIWDLFSRKHAAKVEIAVAPASAVGKITTAPNGTVVGPRGVRNNNPGNLNYAHQTGAQLESGPGARFAAFGTMAEGIAALATQLKLYASRGIDTIAAIVNKYAPASDNNNVGAYIAALTRATGVGANAKLNLDDSDTMAALMKGIIKHEGNGSVSDDQISAGARLANRTNTTNRGGDTSTSEVKIAQVTINTKATDAAGIARDAQSAFRAYPMIAPQANTGLN